MCDVEMADREEYLSAPASARVSLTTGEREAPAAERPPATLRPVLTAA